MSQRLKDTTQLLTAPEVCDMLKISLSTLRQWTSLEKIPVIRFGHKGGMVRYFRSDIEAMIKANYQPVNEIWRGHNGNIA